MQIHPIKIEISLNYSSLFSKRKIFRFFCRYGLSIMKFPLKAELFLKKNPKISLSIVSKYSETEKSVLIDIMKKQNYGVVLNNVLTDYLDEEAQWAIDQGLSSNKDIPDYNSFINTNYLTELKPAAVTI